MYTELEYWLWFTLAFGPANARKWNVYSKYGTIENCYERLSAGDLTNVHPKDIRSVRSATSDRVYKLIDLCDKNGIGVYHYDHPLYPQRLSEIYNPPSVLFAKGDMSGIEDSLTITAVGTRRPSEYSVAISEKLCSDLASQGVRIASGFAVGLDSVAHRSAIQAGGKTYAILPCGHLYDYPPENAEAKAVVEAHGAVISEYFPGDTPSPVSFRARNRILSGISLGTVVLQAGASSGSLSTVSFAVSQGRDIFCLPPHELYNDSYAGVIGLLRNGATPVFDSSDIIDSYKRSHPHILPKSSGVIISAGSSKEMKTSPEPAEKKEKLSKRETDPSLVKSAVIPHEELSGTKKRIYDYISEHGETHLDELSVGIGDVLELEAYLTELELDGLIRSLAGNRFSI